MFYMKNKDIFFAIGSKIFEIANCNVHGINSNSLVSKTFIRNPYNCYSINFFTQRGCDVFWHENFGKVWYENKAYIVLVLFYWVK